MNLKGFLVGAAASTFLVGDATLAQDETALNTESAFPEACADYSEIDLVAPLSTLSFITIPIFSETPEDIEERMQNHDFKHWLELYNITWCPSDDSIENKLGKVCDSKDAFMEVAVREWAFIYLLNEEERDALRDDPAALKERIESLQQERPEEFSKFETFVDTSWDNTCTP